MDRRKLLGTVRTVALRSARTTGRASVRIADEVQARIAARRSSRTPAPAVWSPPVPPPEPSPAREPTGRRESAEAAAPSPVRVARAVERNSAGLTRTTTQPTRPTPVRRSSPGDKLPARAGQGILGV